MVSHGATAMLVSRGPMLNWGRYSATPAATFDRCATIHFFVHWHNRSS
jgi:hypothetical protein